MDTAMKTYQQELFCINRILADILNTNNYTLTALIGLGFIPDASH